MLVVMAGLPASGKSSLARALSTALPGFLLDKDEVRAFLFKDRVDYSREQNDLCVNAIYSVAQYLLKEKLEQFVILDGRTYSRHYQLDAVKAAAQQVGAKLKLIECVCSVETARSRLSQAGQAHLAKDRTFAMYQESRANAEVIPDPKLVIDTGAQTPEASLKKALDYIRA